MSAVKLNTSKEVQAPKVESAVTRPASVPVKGGKPSGDHVVHGKLPEAPKVVSGVRANRFGSVAQALGKDPVNSLLARLDGMSDTEAAAFLGKAFSDSIKGIA